MCPWPWLYWLSLFFPLASRSLNRQFNLALAELWLITTCTRDLESRRWLIWLPVRDLLSVRVGFVGAFSHRVRWRGDSYDVSSDGRMAPAGSWIPEWLRRRFDGLP
jgi:hypothetical protein